MFDFAWSEIALIGVVALIAIGPKDLPVAIKAVAGLVKKARKMAGEFQTHVDELVREADLGDVRNQFNEIRNLDIRGTIARAVDGDGTIKKAFTDDPFKTSNYTPAAPSATAELSDALKATAPDDATAIAGDPLPPPEAEAKPAPAFIPPGVAKPPEPPAFLPPGTRLDSARSSTFSGYRARA